MGRMRHEIGNRKCRVYGSAHLLVDVACDGEQPVASYKSKDVSKE